MPVPYQIVPEGSVFRPKVETHINDNSEVLDTYLTGGGTVTSALCVFASPKGRDNEVITITGGQLEFLEEYGLGPFKLFGQPLMNAYAAANAATSTQAMVHCLRVTAPDAAYSTATLIAKYKFVEQYVIAAGKKYYSDTACETEKGTLTAATNVTKVTNDYGTITVSGVTYYVKMSDATVSPSKMMQVYYVIKPSDEPLNDLADLEFACIVDEEQADAEGFKSVKLFSIAYRGRGLYGQNVRFRITSDTGSDKNNEFKNYKFAIYRNEEYLDEVEAYSVCMLETALYSGQTLSTDDVINDSSTGSKVVRIKTFYEGFEKLYNLYLEENPETEYTLNDFDILLGLDKNTRQKIINLSILPADDATPSTGETAVNISASTGVALLGGSEGSLDESNPNRQTVLNGLYKDAFAGEIDPRIVSRNRYPTTFIFDADFPVNVKLQMVALALRRTDCMVMLDFGLNIATKASVAAYYDDNFADGVVDNRVVTFEPYCMKVRDPYTKKVVTVTSTYWLANNYFTHIYGWKGKHRPMAGNRFGIIDGYIPNSIYPVYDEDIEPEMMDELADRKCNIAAFNQNQVVVRKMQNTSQSKLSSLTEQNNVLVLLDVKRDCERLVANYEYDFSEPEDIARFNVDVETVTQKYQTQQVRRIQAHFDKNSWEAARSILHLYVEMVCKDLVKTVIIEIDVNRDDTES